MHVAGVERDGLFAVLRHLRLQGLNMRCSCMLQVFKAILDGSEEVAVKFLNPRDVSNAGALAAKRANFESEIQIMRLCKHENVVACLGSYVDKVCQQEIETASGSRKPELRVQTC